MKKKYSLEQSIDSIILRAITDFNSPQIELDEQLYFFDAKYLKDDVQDYVIRFRKDCLMLPSGKVLPCVALDYKFLGRVRIEEVLVSTIIDLADEDAQMCYFENKEDLLETFSRIHQHKFKPDDFISIYKLGAFLVNAS